MSKTEKPNATTEANHKERTHCSVPIKTQSRYLHVVDVKGGKTCASEWRFVLVLLLIGWQRRVIIIFSLTSEWMTKWREFCFLLCESLCEVINTKANANYFWHSVENRAIKERPGNIVETCVILTFSWALKVKNHGSIPCWINNYWSATEDDMK